MDWGTYLLARQYLVEEFVGTKVREAKRIEEEQAKAAAKALRSR